MRQPRKTCKQCLKSFRPRHRGPQTYCSAECCKRYTRQKLRLKKYGISAADFAQMVSRQGSACAICGNDSTSIDHDHETGEVRGLLCHSCNSGLGFFRDDLERLGRAALYLIEATKHPPSDQIRNRFKSLVADPLAVHGAHRRIGMAHDRIDRDLIPRFAADRFEGMP